MVERLISTGDDLTIPDWVVVPVERIDATSAVESLLTAADAAGARDAIGAASPGQIYAQSRGESVTQWGAVGGGADDSSAIAAAVSEAGAGGGSVYFRPGVWLSDALTLPSRVLLDGDGAATLKMRTAAPNFLQINGSRSGVRGMVLDADGKASNWVVDIATDVTDSRILESEVTGAAGTTTTALVRIRSGCHRTIIANSWLHGVTTATVGRGVLISGTTGTVQGVKIHHTTIEDIESPSDGDGIVVQDFPGRVDVMLDNITTRRCRKRGFKVQAGGVQITSPHVDMTYDSGVAHPYAGISIYADDVSILGGEVFGVVSVGMVEIGGAGQDLENIVISGLRVIGDTANQGASADGITSMGAALRRSILTDNVLRGTRHGVRLQNILDSISISSHFSSLTGSAIVLDDNSLGGPERIVVPWATLTSVAQYTVTTDGGSTPGSMVLGPISGVGAFGAFGSNASAGSRLGFHGNSGVARGSLAAAGTDAATTMALANDLRAKLIARGDFS